MEGKQHTAPDGKTYIIRKAKVEDCPSILGFIQGLAKYQNMSASCVMTVAQLEKDGFGESPLYHCFVIEDEASSELVGHAINYYRYSTFTGQQLHLEDIFIKEECRGAGLARALVHQVAKFAAAKGCTALDWSCLSWNISAVKFYLKLGAINTTEHDKWESYSLHGEHFKNFVNESS